MLLAQQISKLQIKIQLARHVSFPIRQAIPTPQVCAQICQAMPAPQISDRIRQAIPAPQVPYK